MDSLHQIAENKIQQAMKDGLFDNLPGKGKPLPLDDDPLVDPAWRMASQLLKNQGFTLPWIEVRREIETEMEAACKALASALRLRQAVGPNADPDWHRELQTFQSRITDLNRRILSYNVQAPLDRFHLRLIDVDEMVRVISSQLSVIS